MHESLVKHEKNLGRSACLFADLLNIIDRANNYSRGVRFSDSAPTASTSVSLRPIQLLVLRVKPGSSRTQLTVYNSVT